jgi:hypothetical protein
MSMTNEVQLLRRTPTMLPTNNAKVFIKIPFTTTLIKVSDMISVKLFGKIIEIQKVNFPTESTGSFQLMKGIEFHLLVRSKYFDYVEEIIELAEEDDEDADEPRRKPRKDEDNEKEINEGESTTTIVQIIKESIATAEVIIIHNSSTILFDSLAFNELKKEEREQIEKRTNYYLKHLEIAEKIELIKDQIAELKSTEDTPTNVESEAEDLPTDSSRIIKLINDLDILQDKFEKSSKNNPERMKIICEPFNYESVISGKEDNLDIIINNMKENVYSFSIPKDIMIDISSIKGDEILDLLNQ